MVRLRLDVMVRFCAKSIPEYLGARSLPWHSQVGSGLLRRKVLLPSNRLGVCFLLHRARRAGFVSLAHAPGSSLPRMGAFTSSTPSSASLADNLPDRWLRNGSPAV